MKARWWEWLVPTRVHAFGLGYAVGQLVMLFAFAVGRYYPWSRP